MATFYGLDFETYGDVDLRTYGRDRYMASPHFQPLIASVTHKASGARKTYDFVLQSFAMDHFMRFLNQTVLSKDTYIIAHSANFERGVLGTLRLLLQGHSIDEEELRNTIIDSAVIARQLGAASHLEAAAPQLTNLNKLEDGRRLIQLFSIPNEANNWQAPTAELLRSDPSLMKDWALFAEYCEQDAAAGEEIGRLSYEMYNNGSFDAFWKEIEYERLTAKQNLHGWQVDMPLVRAMQDQYEDNSARALETFRDLHDIDQKLNLNSTTQLQRWCRERGVVSASFDENRVEELLVKINKRLTQMTPDQPKYLGYVEVRDMLETKRTIGGSSLKKLQGILNTTGEDNILRDSYMHAGAGQTYRTTGKGVQMQNLKRLGPKPDDMEAFMRGELPREVTTNDWLAANLRQCFTSRYKDGALVVGDFSSVESRGLAYIAGANAKLDAFRAGKDLYKVLASSMYGVPYEEVTKEQRQGGKVGELSCGYGAGGGAVHSFATGMGIEMTPEEAQQISTDWRLANPEVVETWGLLEGMLQDWMRGVSRTARLANGLSVSMVEIGTPDSLRKLHPTAKSSVVQMSHQGEVIFQRVFHGMHLVSRGIGYFKPTDRKTGDLWVNSFMDPKTKQRKNHTIYGGKLTGILVQSMCREMFFDVMKQLEFQLHARIPDALLIGQFHDELVVDAPQREIEEVKQLMFGVMQTPPLWANNFPLTAEIKEAYRYIK